jgi:uncharacterized membrane protein YeaQ/YmgE (transglycosylase-associated protein family)
VSTLAIGVCGSFVGGFINYIAGNGDPFQTSGIVLGVLGGVVTCLLYKKTHFDRIKRMFLNK